MLLSKKFPWFLSHKKAETAAAEEGKQEEDEVRDERDNHKKKKRIHKVLSSKVLRFSFHKKANPGEPKPKPPQKPEDVAGSRGKRHVVEEQVEEDDGDGEGEAVLCDVCGKPKLLSRCFLDTVTCPQVLWSGYLRRHVGEDPADERWPADGMVACPGPVCLDGFLRLPTPPPAFFCSICMERKPLSDCFFGVHDCDHVFCSECVSLYVAAMVGENLVRIRCPDPECNHGWLFPEACRPLLPPAVFDRWCAALCDAMVADQHVANGVPQPKDHKLTVTMLARFYCPYPDCWALLVKEEGGGDKEGEESMMLSECLHCNRPCCAQCKVPWHENLTCEAYRRNLKEKKDVQE